MQDRKISFAKLAAATGRNIKSVQRWVYEGRIPRNPQAAAIARLLHIDPNWLWPQVRATIHPDLINMYAHVGEMPHTIWTQSAVQADHAIDIAADSSPVLPFKLSACSLTWLLLESGEGLLAFDGFADVVAGGWLPVG